MKIASAHPEVLQLPYTILVVDDQSTARELLTTLLGYAGYRLLQARDGREALELVRTEHPDLVITDVLMPGMDGYELVRQMRADGELAATNVIFYTAAYHEQEARTLAEQVGVQQVLTKPSEPEALLHAVDLALRGQPARPRVSPPVDFDRNHLRLVSDRLVRSMHELETLNERLAALVKLGLHLASEADPRQVLQTACDAARDLVGAETAVIQILDPLPQTVDKIVTSGAPLKAGRLQRSAARMPSADAPRDAWLLQIPLATPAHTYGTLSLSRAAGAAAFNSDDERLTAMLAAQLALTYENAQRYETIQQYAEAIRARAEEFSALVENAPDAIARMDADLRFQYANGAAEQMLGQSLENLRGKTLGELGMSDPPLRTWELSLQRVFRLGREQSLEFSLTTASGEQHYLARAVPEFSADDIVSSVLTISHDITERRQAEVERAELYRAQSERERRLHELVAQIMTTHKHELQRNAHLARAEELTPRERDILKLLTAGLTNREIGQRVNLSAGTVKNHIARLLPKLDATDRTQAAVRAVELGFAGSSDT
jgi:PAS domain S-box-containing protein